ncbi:hypothetical protein [Variovorax sp. Root434]|uniref:hypothetical protein n=1 Tax=unclassified Variovorax TaxID=663243 RepID=UPI0006F9F947|nr:hypothetical protein [Variovorax sp. Root434]KQX29283.1 hypothetical protein ASD05_03685 [Variovorax sp. Root434]
MNKTIEVDGLAVQAIAIACDDAKSSGLHLENYKLVMVEGPDEYSVSWEAKSKPQGHRGALPGLAELCLRIGKSGGGTFQKHWSR